MEWKELLEYHNRHVYAPDSSYEYLARRLCAIDEALLISDPILLLSAVTQPIQQQQLYLCLLALRWYRWKSQRYYANLACEDSSISHAQDLVLIQTLFQLDRSKISCLFVHQLFLESPILIRAVFESTVPLDLIPVLVEYIPSLRKRDHRLTIDVLVDGAIDMLSKSETQTAWLQNIALAANLAVKYPMPKSLDMAQTCVQAISSRRTHLSSENMPFVVDALSRMLFAFPTLVDKIAPICLGTSCFYYVKDIGVEAEESVTRIEQAAMLVDKPIYRKQFSTLFFK